MKLVVLVIGVVATIAAALTAAAIAIISTERGRAATATVAERFDPQVTQVRRAIEPGVESATKVLRRIPVVSDRLPASIAIEGSPSVTDRIAEAADTAADTVADAAGDAIEAAGDAVETVAG